MARIAETELERIKRETDLQALVTASGVVLRRHGADLLGLCPFHEDREPSLVVSAAKGLWHCLGACRAGGSAIDWVMRRDRVSFRHAVEVLRGSVAAEPGPRPRSRPVLEPLVESDAEDRALLVRVVGYYHETLKRSPEALAYLEKRGLTHPELIDRFRLGFADRTLGYRLPKKTLKVGAEIRGRLQRLGILRASGHEHFRGSLVVPVLGESGDVLEMYGRKIGERLRDGTPDHLYLPGAHRGVWNVEALRAGQVILCESLIDAMSFWCAGFRNVTASYGVAGFTDEHLAALRQCGVKRVLIAYDRDTAGDRAAAALVPVLEAAGIASARIQFPRGFDANAYALKVQPASKSLALLIESAGVLSEAGAHAETTNETEAAKEENTPPLAAPSVHEPPTADVLPDIPAEVRGEDIVLRIADRSYRVRGLAKNTTPDALRINLLARRGAGLHADTLDLYVARQRAAYVQHAARELGVKDDVVRKDLGQVLLKLEALQEERLAQAANAKPERVTLSARDREEALELLRAPNLLDRILADFERCGLVGEETNRLAGYVAAVSRKLERPLAVIVQSSSAAGKTSLMDAVLGFVPEEERVQYSALTGQSLFYMEGIDLRHKVLAVVEEAGAEKASYALKLLQSEGELTIASTGKDPESGRLVTHEYRVEGPVMIFLTTTAVEIDEELLNRAVVLTVSEEREQTRRVHRAQRERRTLAGLLAREESAAVLALHRNAQRLLRPLAVVNPYAPHLTFLDTRTRMRRDHEKYLTLIDAIALLHQHQREVKTIERAGRRIEYVEASLDDIAAANHLADAVLGRSIDELSPQSRTLLGELDRMVREVMAAERVERAEVRFSRADVRRYTGWTDFQVRTHLQRLESLEYVLAHRGSRGQCYVYELLYAGEGTDGEPFVMGLLDVEALRQHYDANFEGSDAKNEYAKAENEGPSSHQRASNEPGTSIRATVANRLAGNALPAASSRTPKTASLETGRAAASYVVTPAANGVHA
jgi:DNA primase